MTLQGARLTVSADVDGDGTAEMGVFEFLANVEITPSVERGFLAERGGSAFTLLADFLDLDVDQRQNIYLDTGGGVHSIEISFSSWEGAQDQDGNPLQWGNTGDPSTVTQADATGAHPATQMSVLEQYTSRGRIDSTNPATLEYLERHDGGLYDPLEVVFDVTVDRASDDISSFDGSVTCLSALDVQQSLDALKQEDFG